MKKLLIILAGLLLIGLTGGVMIARSLGLSVLDPMSNIRVGMGLSAKLACSGYYVGGMQDNHVRRDIRAYSPALKYFWPGFTRNPVVQASFLNMTTRTAAFRPGLGCTLNTGNTRALDDLSVPQLERTGEPWPAGSGVTTVIPELQEHSTMLMYQDNIQGLDTRALVIVKGGVIVGEVYGGSFDERSRLLGWSMAKSLTSIIIGNMQRNGLLELDETDLFPEWQDNRADISLEDMLQMTSGLEFDETYAPGTDATKMLFDSVSASELPLTSSLNADPGSYFSYSSGTTNLLSRFVTSRMGGPQQMLDYLVGEIYEPIALADTTFEPDPSGVLVGSSFVYATARDWARMGQLMLNEGELNGYRILSQEYVARATAPNGSDNDPRYGYQFWLNRGGSELRWPLLPEDAYAMMGNRQQSVMIIPSKDVVMVRLGWTSGRYPMQERYSEILSKLETI